MTIGPEPRKVLTENLRNLSVGIAQLRTELRRSSMKVCLPSGGGDFFFAQFELVERPRLLGIRSTFRAWIFFVRSMTLGAFPAVHALRRLGSGWIQVVAAEATPATGAASMRMRRVKHADMSLKRRFRHGPDCNLVGGDSERARPANHDEKFLPNFLPMSLVTHG
jgi:hypothetical protein